MMKHAVIFRLSQLIILFPCALREWINFLTDIGQYERVTKLALQIMSFPTQHNASTLFNRSINSLLLAKFVALLWIVIHFITAALITYGLIALLKTMNADSKTFNQKKLPCFLGLSFGIFSYLFLVGFVSMDYFLSWMQDINFNADIVGYSLPLIGALLYLTVNESSME